MNTISSNVTASKEKEKRKKSQLRARKQEKRKRKRKKKKVALTENNGDNTKACTYQDANITRRVNLFIYFASYSVHN